MKQLRKKAFTLIELLVVIAIIGILATLSVIALSNARAKSRDAKRAGDIKQVQTALELFFNDKGRYPTKAEFDGGILYSTTSTATTTYMQIIPSAPAQADGSCTSGQNTFVYKQTESGNSYTVSYCLGNTTGSLTSGPKCLTPGGVINVDCGFTCGTSQITVANIAEHTCNTGAPDYDKCIYDTVLIGTQCWLKQNMNVGTIVTGVTDQTNNSLLEKYCYNNTSGNCQTYGGLYQWNETMQYSVLAGAQGICPAGWHIPTDAEQNTLDQYLKDNGQTCNAGRSVPQCSTAGTKLQVGGSSGFAALLTGFRQAGGSFVGLSADTLFWSSSINVLDAWSRTLVAGESTVDRYPYDQSDGFSIRCLQN